MEIKLFRHYEDGSFYWGKPIEKLETAFETQPNGDLSRVKVPVLYYLLYATKIEPGSYAYKGSMSQLGIGSNYATITDPVLEVLFDDTKPSDKPSESI